MELTPAEITVLGLILEQPQHGYQLEQVIEQRGIRQWTDIGFSSIYYLLDKLAKRSLIETVGTSPGRKSRRMFKGTKKGREVAKRSTLTLISDVRGAPHPLLVGLANLPLLAEREYDEALRSRLEQLNNRIATVRDAEQAQAPLPLPAREVFSYSLSLLEAEKSWLADRIQVAR